MKLKSCLRRWIKKNREGLHNLADAFAFGVGMVFVGLGAMFLALWVQYDLDLSVVGTGVLALFIGGFNIRLSFAQWKKGGK